MACCHGGEITYITAPDPETKQGTVTTANGTQISYCSECAPEEYADLEVSAAIVALDNNTTLFDEASTAGDTVSLGLHTFTVTDNGGTSHQMLFLGGWSVVVQGNLVDTGEYQVDLEVDWNNDNSWVSLSIDGNIWVSKTSDVRRSEVSVGITAFKAYTPGSKTIGLRMKLLATDNLSGSTDLKTGNGQFFVVQPTLVEVP